MPNARLKPIASGISNRRKPVNDYAALAAKLGIACLALLVAVSVYVFARPSPPDLIAGLHWRSDWLTGYSAYSNSAPSLFYTLAFGLFIGVCASTRGASVRHCVLWIGLAACLELSQAPFIAAPLADWLGFILPAAAWDLIGPYWQRGVFDPGDLLATFAGGAAAILLLSRFSTKKDHESDD